MNFKNIYDWYQEDLEKITINQNLKPMMRFIFVLMGISFLWIISSFLLRGNEIEINSKYRTHLYIMGGIGLALGSFLSLWMINLFVASRKTTISLSNNTLIHVTKYLGLLKFEKKYKLHSFDTICIHTVSNHNSNGHSTSRSSVYISNNKKNIYLFSEEPSIADEYANHLAQRLQCQIQPLVNKGWTGIHLKVNFVLTGIFMIVALHMMVSS